jgi:hypothetical protein
MVDVISKMLIKLVILSRKTRHLKLYESFKKPQRNVGIVVAYILTRIVVRRKVNNAKNAENRTTSQRSVGVNLNRKNTPPPARRGKRYEHKFKKPVKPLRNIEHETCDTESSDSDENYLYAVTNTTTPKVNVTVCQHSFKATVDTGASINVNREVKIPRFRCTGTSDVILFYWCWELSYQVHSNGLTMLTKQSRKRINVCIS